MDVGVKAPVGMVLRVTDIFTEHWRFAADFTFQDECSFDMLNSLL
jgi:hypothetical protein